MNMHVFYRNVNMYEQIHMFAMKFSLNDFVKVGKICLTYIRPLHVMLLVISLCKRTVLVRIIF